MDQQKVFKIKNMLIYIINVMFFVGLAGLYLNRQHIIVLLIALELVFLSINLNIINTIVNFDLLIGYIYILCILTVAAAEVAIGLALLVLFYRIRGGITLDFIGLLKG
jgi:NADH:ubiquinone oxidoreductase subunit K